MHLGYAFALRKRRHRSTDGRHPTRPYIERYADASKSAAVKTNAHMCEVCGRTKGQKKCFLRSLVRLFRTVLDGQWQSERRSERTERSGSDLNTQPPQHHTTQTTALTTTPHTHTHLREIAIACTMNFKASEQETSRSSTGSIHVNQMGRSKGKG